jgi:hypothetical protein
MQAGTIIAINRRRGMFVVRLEEGGCAAFSLLDGLDLELHGQVKGNLDALVVETLLYLDTGEPFEVFGETGPCAMELALRMVK